MAEEVMVPVVGGLDAVKLLVESGADVSYNSKMLYKSIGKYRLLSFNNKSNLINDEEENFDKLEDAVKRFGELSQGKLI